MYNTLKEHMATKQNQKRTTNVGLAVLAGAVILFFLVIGFGREYVGNMQIEHEIRDRELERAQLLDEQTSTLRLIEQFSSEYYLEKEARIKHGLGKDGETLILVQDTQTQIGYNGFDYDEDENSYLEEKDNPLRWYYYFFEKSVFDELKTL